MATEDGIVERTTAAAGRQQRPRSSSREESRRKCRRRAHEDLVRIESLSYAQTRRVAHIEAHNAEAAKSIGSLPEEEVRACRMMWLCRWSWTSQSGCLWMLGDVRVRYVRVAPPTRDGYRALVWGRYVCGCRLRRRITWGCDRVRVRRRRAA